MINAQVGDLSSLTTKYQSPAQKVFANIRRVGKGFSKVDTLLFDGILIPQQVHDDVADDVADDVTDVVADVVVDADAEPTPPSPTPGKLAELDADEDVTLEEVTAEVAKDADVQGRLEESQAQVYHLDLEHAQKVLCMQEHDKAEPAEVEEVLEVVTAAKLMTKVVTTATTPISAAHAPKVSAPRKRRGVIIQDTQEAATASLSMTYDEIRPIFEKHFNSIVAFLEKGEKELEEEASKQTTPLALKVLVVDYQIHTEHNKPYYKIIRVDGTHQLFLSFISLLRNFDREDLEMLWKIVQERFASSEPKNFSDDFLLNTLKTMFEKPDVEANI
nr:hypothetical protein [Tanacetum cinerariifolium]